jgi:predicted SprT family Zn-dependent metalloprotease
MTKFEINEIYHSIVNQFEEHSEQLGFYCLLNNDLLWFDKIYRKIFGMCTSMYKVPYKDEYIEEFEIEVNPILLEFDKDKKYIIENTIAHELCHTLPNCYNHGAEFKKKAKLIHNLFGYIVDTNATIEESQYLNKLLLKHNPKYKIVCNGCGVTIPYYRLNNKIKQPNTYKCIHCGERFTPYEYNKNTNRYNKYKNK